MTNQPKQPSEESMKIAEDLCADHLTCQICGANRRAIARALDERYEAGYLACKKEEYIP